MAAGVTLEQTLSRLTREGELYERLPEGRVRCYACGHRCLILPGQKGICKVRYNEDGRLMVPAGYVAALQLDPIEKKPFFHAYPGARALSFGMLGCDLHCAYCTAPQTIIATSRGPISIKQLFDSAATVAETDQASIRVMPGLEVYSHTGRIRRVRQLFRHPYSGLMVKLEPAYLLPLRVTPDHEILTVTKAELESGAAVPKFLPAGQLTTGHYLAIPKQFDFSRAAAFEVAEILRSLVKKIRYRHRIGPEFLRKVLRLSERGLSSRDIGSRFGKGASHVRHLRSKVRRGVWDLRDLSHKPAEVLIEEGRVRVSKEHGPGIPERIPLDENLAAILGYYAAEGCTLHHKNRVHSAEVVFSLGHHEEELAQRISRMISKVFGVEPFLSKRRTTLAVVVSKVSVALFLESLCRTGSEHKRLPAELFSAPRPVVEAFLKAYVEGDGHWTKGGMMSAATVSRELALGIAWLALKTRRFPSIRQKRQPKEGEVLGRTVRLAPNLFRLNWFEDSSKRRWLREDERNFYVPVHRVKTYAHKGFVYNLEVEEDHSYLAQFVGTHNCQNALTSQALRDPMMGVPPELVTPHQIVNLALHNRARVLTSTYNEPLITSEWAVEVFKEGKARGLVCSYVSNGNATAEVLDYIRPYVDLYKVDLKSFDDKHYRQLGGVLKTILEGIRMIHGRGFWLEIVTLVIPGFNDSDAELRDVAQFLVSISPDIPWHVTAFHQDYKMTEPANTTAKALIRAAEIGVAQGLRYVYAGNLPGQVGPFENTCCPSCKAVLIQRVGYTILKDLLTPSRGVCPSCSTKIPGVWG
jgi:pyruvate formate lyase activating enzyme